MSSPFLAHTAWLCFAFGALLASICPRLDDLLSTNVRTPEAQLFARHLGIALLLLGYLCLPIAGSDAITDAGGTNGSMVDEEVLSRILMGWHAIVVSTFVVEFCWVGAFRDASALTRLIAYGGLLLHVVVFIEGILEGDWIGLSHGNFYDYLGGIVSDSFDRSFNWLFPDTSIISTIACCVIAMGLICSRLTKAKRRECESLSGELVVITGAAGGIGRELSLAFAKEGSRLALWDNREKALQETAAWLSSRGVDSDRVRTFVVDVSDAKSVSTAAETLCKSEGGRAPRVVVSNAAVMRGRPLLDCTDEEIRLDFSVNALAGFWVVRACLRQMLNEGGQDGKEREMVIVTMGSIMAELPARGQAEYCASKAALSQLHECLRWELKRAEQQYPRTASSIRSLLIQPYAVNTSMISGAALLGEGTTATRRRFALIRRVLPPLEPVDVAQRVLRAVKCGEERVYIPRIVGWLPLILQLLPASLRDYILSYCGAFDGTDGFSGCAPSRRNSHQ